jgi:hypothetical protein
MGFFSFPDVNPRARKQTSWPQLCSVSWAITPWETAQYLCLWQILGTTGGLKLDCGQFGRRLEQRDRGLGREVEIKYLIYFNNLLQ